MKNKRKTIQSRLVLLLVMVLVPVIGIQAYMYYGAFKERKAAELRSNLEIARAVAKSFDTFVKDVLRLERAVGFALTSSPRSNREDSNRILLRIREDNPELWEIFWVSPKGVVLSATGTQFLGMNLADREYFKEIVAGREYVISDLLLSRTTGKPSFTISRAIRDEKGLLIGVVTIGILPERLDKVLGVERFKGGGFAVVDSKGMLVFRYPVIETTWEERNWLKQYPQFGDALNKGKEVSATVYAPFEGKNRMVGFAPIPSIGWAASAGQREEEVTGPILAAIERNAAIAGLILAMAFFIALLFARRLANPIMMLRQHALALGRGQGRQPLPAQSVSELNDLADAFNTMDENVRVRETALQESERRWAITLASIGDAVIATDTAGKVTFMNAVAEELTGWTSSDAATRSVPEVFNIINEHTRLEVENPVAKVLRDGMVVGLANHTILVKRDGTEVPIDDSGAPIRGADGETSGVVLVFRDITERKQADEAVQGTLHRFYTVLSGMYTGLLLVADEGRVEFANQALCDYFDLNDSPADLVGLTAPNILAKIRKAYLYPDEAIARIKDIVDRGQPVRGEEVPMSNGRELLRDFIPIRVNGKSYGRLWYHTDITKRKRAEEAAHLSEEKFALAFANNPAAIAMSRLEDGLIIEVNETWLALTGYSREEALGHFAREMHIWPATEASSHFVRELREKGSLRGWEQEFLKKNGEVYAAQLSAQVLTLRDEKVILSTLVDITERKKMEEELERHHRYLEEMVQERTVALRRNQDLLNETQRVSKVGGWEFDVITRRVTWTDEVYRIHEVSTAYDPSSPEQDIQFYAPEDRERIANSFQRAVAQGEHYDLELQLVTARGNRLWVRTMGQAESEGGKVVRVSGNIMDITERKQLEEQLRQSQKMEAIGTLAGGVAHDFNNVLAAILGFTEMVIDDVPDRQDVQRNLQNVLKSAMRAKDLVKQILAFSRKTNYERSPLALTPLIKETVHLLRASIPTTIDIRLDIVTSWDRILAAPVEVQQIVMNLATNASLAMREKGGTLEVSLTDIDFTPDSPVLEPDVMPGEYVQLTVKDTGVGMSPDVMKRVFEPFFTTREVGKGTGMGLAVVYGIVKDLQGTITVESAPGVGSTFRVFLPKVHTEVLKEETHTAQISRGTERILFIDDEEMLTEWGQTTLERLGYTATAVTDSKEALDMFSSDPSRFDLVITDYTMPGFTGVQIAREFLKLRPDIPIILCTGHSETVSPEIAKEAGITEYLMKPLAKQELAEAVRHV